MTFIQPNFGSDRLAVPTGVAALEHDKDMAAKFLTALDPSATQFTFQFFGDGAQTYAEIVHGSLDDVWPKVQALNAPAHRVGVFVTINETDFGGRKTDNIIRARALYVDADGPDQLQRCREAIRASRAVPSMVVRTSTDRAHFYWCCDDLARNQFSALQSALIGKLGTDQAVKDLARVMRLPGTLHLKDPSSPQLVTVQVSGQVRAWKIADLATSLNLSLAPTRDRAKPESSSFPPADADRLRRLFGPDYMAGADLGAGLQTNVEEIKSAVAAIPASAIAAEPDWVKLARGIAHEARVYSEQVDELSQVQDSASRLAPGYDEHENRRRFDRYVDEALNRENPITIATTFDMARKHGWTGWSPAVQPQEAGSPFTTTQGNPSPGFGRTGILTSGVKVSFSSISHRKLLYGIDLTRGETTVLASPGGVGKSSLAIGISAAVVTGRKLLEERVWGNELSALYVNAEDSCMEMGRRVWAFCLQHQVAEADLARFYLLGADDWRTQKLSFLRTERGASALDHDGLAFFDSLLEALNPDVVVLDPLVALCGGGNMNDNAAMALVMRALKRLASKFDCAILLLHHTPERAETLTAPRQLEARPLSSTLHVER